MVFFRSVCGSLALSFFFAGVSPASFAQQSSGDPEALIREWHEAPSIPFVSEQEQENLRRDFEKADVLVTARVGSVLLTDIGFGGPAIPMTRVFFEELTLQDGKTPEGNSFLSRETPDALKVHKGQRVIAALSRKDEKSTTLFVTRLVPADKGSLQLLIEAIRVRRKKSGASDCEKQPEPDVCPA